MAQQPKEDSVVEVLLLAFAHTCVPDTDCPGKVGIEPAFHRFCVPFDECIAECVQCRRIPACFLLKPFLNLIDEYLPYLTIRYRQLISLPILAAPLRQIAGGKKDAPEVIDGGIEFPIGQLLVDLLRNRPSVNQPFQLFPGSRL